ncbi:coat protein [Bacillus paralicheniformis]|uniref:coat protein n=1 Tax=Bacillus paralicheniformis TaxID=1648923 RepID=UPI00224349E2|nr:coat protein [Bacillus paralicheniformis]UZN53020.1 coat protein [Bacillus paralicheniformis]
MAVTRVQDVIIPEVFNRYTMNNTVEKTAIYRSGILQPVPGIVVPNGGDTVNMPFWNDLEGDPEAIQSDFALTPEKITSGKDVARVFEYGKAWSSEDLAAELAGSDPMRAIAQRVNNYWERQYQKMIFRMLDGVFADNVANDGADLVLDLSSGSGKKYTTYIFGSGAIGYAGGMPKTPTETDRNSLKGEDILINRKKFIMHPRGFKWTEAAVAKEMPTLAEMADGANYDRVYDKKKVRIVKIITNEEGGNGLTGAAILDAQQLLGDAKDVFTSIAMHSLTHTNLQKQNLIEFIPNNRADVGFGTYMGKSIIVDDSLPVVTPAP